MPVCRVVTNAGTSDKAAAHSVLRLKYFQVELDCNIVEMNRIVEPACLSLQEPPTLN